MDDVREKGSDLELLCQCEKLAVAGGKQDVAVTEEKGSAMDVPPNLDWRLSLQWNADLEKFQDFRIVILYYKCRPCLQYKGRCLGTLDCPGFHSEMDRRRSPAQFTYDSTPCSRVKPSRSSSWKEPSICPLGDSCSFCHTRSEQQLHPDVYRTVRCRDQMRDGRCPRLRFCAFSHNEDELQELIDFWQTFKHSNQSRMLVFSPSWSFSPPGVHTPSRPKGEQRHPPKPSMPIPNPSGPVPRTSPSRSGRHASSFVLSLPEVRSRAVVRKSSTPCHYRSSVYSSDLGSSDESPEPSPTSSLSTSSCDSGVHVHVTQDKHLTDEGHRLSRLSMAIDSVVASETSRELRIETRLKKCSCGGRQSSGSSSSNSSATTMTSSSGGSSTGEYYLFQ